MTQRTPTSSTLNTRTPAGGKRMLHPGTDVEALRPTPIAASEDHDHDAHPTDDPDVRERLKVESPDGGPPEPAVRRTGLLLLAIVVIVATVALMVPLWNIGGPLAVLIGSAIAVGFFLLGQAPAWGAGVQRREDADRVADEMHPH